MTAPATATPDSRATGGTRRRRRIRLVGLGVGLVLLVAVVGALIPRGDASRPLDPASASSSGTRALAQVLGHRGIPVYAVRTPAELRTAGAAPTIVVVDRGDVGQASLSALREHLGTSGPSRLVLLDPSDETLDALGIPLEAVASEPVVEAGCSTSLADPGDVVLGSTLYRMGDAAMTGCYRDEDGAVGLVEVPADGTRPRTIVFGGGGDLTNAHITRASHAALALRMLGTSSSVLWYVPPAAESAADPTAPAATDARLPQWLAPALVVLAATAVLFLLWQGRRFGPLVTEPLPVVVPAAETMRARARMYSRSGDVPGVAELLARAAQAEIRTRLRLPADTSVEHLASAVERATGEPAAEVVSLLQPTPPPSTAEALTAHHRRLRLLTRKVRRS